MFKLSRIKIFDGTEFKAPKIFRIKDVETLKQITDDNKEQLYVYDGDKFKRVTYRSRTIKIVDDAYISGSFKLLPATGYCCCTTSEEHEAPWYFRATIYKESDESKNIFKSELAHGYVQIIWNADGTITFEKKYYNTIKSIKSSNKVMANNWVYLNVYQNKGSDTAYIVFNDVLTKGAVDADARGDNAKNTVGDTGVRFKNYIYVAGMASKDLYATQLNASIISGTDGSNYEGVTHVEDTHDEIEYY